MGDLEHFDSFVRRLRCMADYYKQVYVYARPLYNVLCAACIAMHEDLVFTQFSAI